MDEVAKQVLEDVNNVPQPEVDDDIDEEMLETIAQKMIKDLEKAAQSDNGTSHMSNRES